MQADWCPNEKDQGRTGNSQRQLQRPVLTKGWHHDTIPACSAHIVVLCMQQFYPVHCPHLSIVTLVMSAFSEISHTVILFGLDLYNDQMTEMPNNYPKASACCTTGTCKLAWEEWDSSLCSAMNQFYDSGQAPLSFKFQFCLGEMLPISASKTCHEDELYCMSKVSSN